MNVSGSLNSQGLKPNCKVMEKRQVLFSLCVFVLSIFQMGVFAQNQQWEWARNAVGSRDDRTYSVNTDAFGNVYVAGYFESSTLGFGTTTLSNQGYHDVFVAKYDAIGNVLWAKSVGGSNLDEAHSIHVDAVGNVYVSGYFRSASLSFADTGISNVNSSYYDVFVLKYDAQGNEIWARSMGGSRSDYAKSIYTDGSGAVYVTGYFSSSSFSFGGATLNNQGGNDLFLLKYDAQGNELWAKSLGGIGNERGNSVYVDALGAVYIGGEFSTSSLGFGGTTLNNAGGGG